MSELFQSQNSKDLNLGCWESRILWNKTCWHCSITNFESNFEAQLSSDFSNSYILLWHHTQLIFDIQKIEGDILLSTQCEQFLQLQLFSYVPNLLSTLLLFKGYDYLADEWSYLDAKRNFAKWCQTAGNSNWILSRFWCHTQYNHIIHFKNKIFKYTQLFSDNLKSFKK